MPYSYQLALTLRFATSVAVTAEIMHYPVVTADGMTYERDASAPLPNGYRSPFELSIQPPNLRHLRASPSASRTVFSIAAAQSSCGCATTRLRR